MSELASDVQRAGGAASGGWAPPSAETACSYDLLVPKDNSATISELYEVGSGFVMSVESGALVNIIS